MMHLTVYTSRDASLIAEWGCNDAPTPQCPFTATTTCFRFRALLTGEGAELELGRV